MKASDFKKKLEKAKTYKDGMDLVDKLSEDQKEELRVCLNVVKDYCGITLRDDLVLSDLETQKRVKESQLNCTCKVCKKKFSAVDNGYDMCSTCENLELTKEEFA